MLGSLIIVLRETLEAALVVGILLAAVSGSTRAKRWIAGGMAIGLAAAGIVALFAETIAASLAGAGQEYFNAVVLLLAAAMLGWHQVWMKSHGRQLAQELQETGTRVTSGAASLGALLIVVAIAVMREGSEVVLFLYGIAIGGTGNRDILIGGLLGLGGGIVLGALAYSGLARIPQRYLFSVTGWMLVLLAAGMAAQAAGYLSQVDVLPTFADPLWDSSALLPEHSTLGQLLHVLIGYNDKPTGVQMLFFGSTIITIVFLTKLIEKQVNRPKSKIHSTLAILFGMSIASVTMLHGEPAHAATKIYSPIVEQGEYAIELLGYRKLASNPGDRFAQYKAEFEHAPTARWLTELVTEFEQEGQGPLKTTAVEWENTFQLTEQGAHWVDFGLLTEYEYQLKDNSRNNLIVGALFEKAFNQQVVNFDFFDEHELGGAETNELSYTARWRWRMRESFEPSIEAFGELGEARQMGSFDSQEHSIGPGIFGAVRFANGAKLRYEGSFLFGVSSAAPNNTARVQLEYEFR